MQIYIQTKFWQHFFTVKNLPHFRKKGLFQKIIQIFKPKNFQHALTNLPVTPSTSPSFNNENLLNGSGSSSSSTNGAAITLPNTVIASDLNKPPDSVDYLSQLIKDKKQLAAFPNVFQHIERLLDNGKEGFIGEDLRIQKRF